MAQPTSSMAEPKKKIKSRTKKEPRTVVKRGVSFLDLPLELRLMVYGYFIPNLKLSVAYHKLDHDFRIRPGYTTKYVNAILQTCKAIRSETLPLFMDQVRLEIDTYTRRGKYTLMPLLPDNHFLLSLPKATFTPASAYMPMKHLIEHLPGLRKLTIDNDTRCHRFTVNLKKQQDMSSVLADPRMREKCIDSNMGRHTVPCRGEVATAIRWAGSRGVTVYVRMKIEFHPAQNLLTHRMVPGVSCLFSCPLTSSANSKISVRC